MELDYKAIGKRVKIARIRADFTQEGLAEKAGLSTTHMSNIETGNSKLSLPMAVALANALSVSVDALLCDNVIHSKEVFSQEIQMLIEDCDDYEIRILTDLLKAAKDTIRRDTLAYSVCLLRGDLPRPEGLPDLIAEHIGVPPLFPARDSLVLCLCQQELGIGCAVVALIGGNELPVLGFLRVLAVVETVFQRLGDGFPLADMVGDQARCGRRLTSSR